MAGTYTLIHWSNGFPLALQKKNVHAPKLKHHMLPWTNERFCFTLLYSQRAEPAGGLPQWPAIVWVGWNLLNSGRMTPNGRASMSSVQILLVFFNCKDPPLQVSAFQSLQPSPCLGVGVVDEECSKAYAIGISERHRLNSRSIALPSCIEGDKTVVGESPCNSAASLGAILVIHHLTK